MTREELERICRPRLDSLWLDLQAVPGLPICSRNRRNKQVILAGTIKGTMFGCWPGYGAEGGVDALIAWYWHLDLLASPIGADVLARRVTVAAGGRAHSVYTPYLAQKEVGFVAAFINQKYQNVLFLTEDEIDFFSWTAEQVPVLAQLDPTCGERVDWGTLGSTQLVNLAALAIVGQHLTAEGQ